MTIAQTKISITICYQFLSGHGVASNSLNFGLLSPSLLIINESMTQRFVPVDRRLKYIGYQNLQLKGMADWPCTCQVNYLSLKFGEVKDNHQTSTSIKTKLSLHGQYTRQIKFLPNNLEEPANS